MHEVGNSEFYADLPPKVLQFMELEPEHTSMRHRAPSFLGAMQGCFGFNSKKIGKRINVR
jgi:hypothetical protein